MSYGSRRAAAAVHERIAKTLTLRGREIDLAVINTIVPKMTASLFGAGEGGTDAGPSPDTPSSPAGEFVIEEGVDFYLTQWVRWWHLQYALRPDDVLVLAQITTKEWVAFDVRTDRSVDAGVRMNRPPSVEGADVRPLEGVSGDILLTAPAGGGTVTWANHLARKIEVYDKDGALIGWIPVFATLP